MSLVVPRFNGLPACIPLACVGSALYEGVEMYWGRPWMLDCTEAEVRDAQFMAPAKYLPRSTASSPSSIRGVSHPVTEYVLVSVIGSDSFLSMPPVSFQQVL
jgi:hypothetical protein